MTRNESDQTVDIVLELRDTTNLDIHVRSLKCLEPIQMRELANIIRRAPTESFASHAEARTALLILSFLDRFTNDMEEFNHEY